MSRFLRFWIVRLLALALCAWALPGIHLAGLGSAVLAVLILGLVNSVARPILVFLTLPITLVTLGLFLLAINGFTFWLAGSVVSGFQVDGASSALLGALIYSCACRLGAPAERTLPRATPA